MRYRVSLNFDGSVGMERDLEDRRRFSLRFLTFARHDLERVDCPKGWMSPEGLQ